MTCPKCKRSEKFYQGCSQVKCPKRKPWGAGDSLQFSGEYEQHEAPRVGGAINTGSEGTYVRRALIKEDE